MSAVREVEIIGGTGESRRIGEGPLILQTWESGPFNPARLFGNDFLVRIPTEVKQSWGADPTTMWVVDQDGNRLYPLDTTFAPHIFQWEDGRSLIAELSGEDPFILVGVTNVTKPKDPRNESVGWNAGVLMLSRGRSGRIEVKDFWDFPQLGKGKNMMPVRASRAANGNLTLDFDIRQEDRMDTISRFRTELRRGGVVTNMQFVQDNRVPSRWWNQVASGLCGGFIDCGDGQEIGLIHGQVRVNEYGVEKRRYYLGFAIRDINGDFKYVSQHPDVIPEHLEGVDRRPDTMALYGVDRGALVLDEFWRRYYLETVVSRGDSQSHRIRVPVPFGAAQRINISRIAAVA